MSSRRDFIKTTFGLSAGALALSPLAETLVSAQKPGSKMQWGFVTYLWGQDWDLPTLIANLEKTDTLGVELRSTHKHGVELMLNAAQRAEVKKRFADSPVVCLGPGSAEEFDSPDPAKLRKHIDDTKEWIKLSHDIGSSGVKVRPNNLHKEVAKEKTIEQIGKSLNEVGKFAGEHGQEIRVEVHGSCAELPTMKAIMDHVDQPSVGLCWNCNNEDLKGQGLEYNFNLAKSRFGKTVHVRELTLGDYPYQELMNLFVKNDYAGWILLEARTKPEDRVKAMLEQRQALRT